MFRDLSSTVYGSFSQGTSSNANPRGLAECHITDGNLTAWPQGYTLYPHIQHIVGPDMQDMLPHGQVNMPINASQEPPKNEPADQYECKSHHQLNAQ